MKIYFVVIFFPVVVYSSDCADVMLQLYNDGVQIFQSVQRGLNSKNPEERLSAIAQIRDLKPDDLDIYKQLLVLLKDESSQVRQAVVEVIGEHRIVDPGIFHTLVNYRQSLQGESSVLRKTVDKALDQIDQETREREADLKKKFEEIESINSKFTQLSKEVQQTMVQMQAPVTSTHYRMLIDIISQISPQHRQSLENHLLSIHKEIQKNREQLNAVITALPYHSLEDFLFFLKHYEKRYGTIINMNMDLISILIQLYKALNVPRSSGKFH